MRAALYCRLSEEDRNKQAGDDSLSIQNQKAMLTQYAAHMGWEVYHVYSDDDYTGSDRRRPAFTQLLRDAEQHLFDIVLCKSQSRFTREMELVEKYIHGLFPQWGIRFVSIVDNADTDIKGNKKSRQINGLINEWYLEDMSENIRSVLTNRRLNGYHIGSFALYGYRKDPQHRGRLLIDEEAATVVREIFRLFASGMGKTAIARLLNDRSIPSPAAYKRLHGMTYAPASSVGASLWRYATISSMLSNEIYIGHMIQGKYGSVSYKTKQNKPRPRDAWFRVENTHQPIVDLPLWEQVQQLLQQRSKPFTSGYVGPFARTAVCAHCGYTMRSTKSRGVRYLKCSTRHLSTDACPGAFIREDALIRLVLDEVKLLSDNYINWAMLDKSTIFAEDVQMNHLHADLSNWNKELNDCNRCIREAYLDKSRKLLSTEDYLELFQHLSAKRERLQQHIQQTEKQIAISVTLPNRHERLWTYTHPDQLTHDIVCLLIDRIEIGKRPSGSQNTPVTIYWSF